MEDKSLSYNQGDIVKWNWGNGTAQGKIVEIYENKVTKTIKNTEITRNASVNEPAYYIEQSDEGAVLKSHSEVEKI